MHFVKTIQPFPSSIFSRSLVLAHLILKLDVCTGALITKHIGYS
jgi:hypothetical protein